MRACLLAVYGRQVALAEVAQGGGNHGTALAMLEPEFEAVPQPVLAQKSLHFGGTPRAHGRQVSELAVDELGYCH